MTEVPEHLLQRARERRAALAGEAPPEGGGNAGSSGGDAGGGGGAVEPAAASAAAPARAAAPAPPAYTGPPQLPPRKQRVPVWAMPVVAAMPLWALLYAGAFGERTEPITGLVAEGAAVYRNNGCAGCHGATGGGTGSGPALTGVLETFEFQQHVDWVKTGSAPFAGQEYAPGKIASGNMPGFEGQLEERDILAVVCYERVQFGGEEPVPEECLEEDAAAAGGEAAGG